MVEPTLLSFLNNITPYLGGVVGIGIIAFFIGNYIGYKKWQVEKKMLKELKEINNKIGDKQ